MLKYCSMGWLFSRIISQATKAEDTPPPDVPFYTRRVKVAAWWLPPPALCLVHCVVGKIPSSRMHSRSPTTAIVELGLTDIDRVKVVGKEQPPATLKVPCLSFSSRASRWWGSLIPKGGRREHLGKHPYRQLYSPIPTSSSRDGLYHSGEAGGVFLRARGLPRKVRVVFYLSPRQTPQVSHRSAVFSVFTEWQLQKATSQGSSNLPLFRINIIKT